MENPFTDPMFLAARKWRHSDEWLKAYYTIRAGHTDRDAFAMARFAEFIIKQREGSSAENGAMAESISAVEREEPHSGR